MKVDFKEEKINLKSFLLKLTPGTEIVLVLQKHDECGGVYTALRIEGLPTRIREMCGNSIDSYFIKSFGLEYGVYGTRDFVVRAVKDEKQNDKDPDEIMCDVKITVKKVVE